MSVNAERNSMKYFVTLYEAGSSGTWLCWLINQHSNFPKYKKQNQKRNLAKQVDINVVGADWWYDKQDFEVNRYEKREQYSNNLKSTKDCFKVLPNHELRLNNYEPNTELLKYFILRNNVKNIIMPYIDGELYDAFRKRWSVLQKEKGVDKYWEDIDMKSYMRMHMERDTYKLRPDVNTCYIDIGKLVMGNLKEYSKLLSFIEEEPLEDFKTITNDYREFAFGKYMK